MLDDRTREAIFSVRSDAAARGIDATLSLHRERSHLMRIGNNSVSLSTSETLTRLDVEVTNGRRQGSHTHLGPISSADDVAAALRLAETKAQVATPKDYDPIVGVVDVPVDESNQHDGALASLDPAIKADVYGEIISTVGDGYNFSGSWSSGLTEVYVVTTANANEAWHAGTDQAFSIVLKHPEQKWELRHQQTGWRAGDVSAGQTIDYFRSLLPVYEGNDGFLVEPGPYTVILGAEAVAEILGMATWTGLFGRFWEEKRGWTSDKQVGDSILGANVTLDDDPSNPQTFGFGFDGYGRRRRRFALVDGGNLAGLAYDASSAGKYGKAPTGHDLDSWSMVMKPGDGPADPLEAVADMGRVLYIPALHYVHIPNPSQGVFTGSSRFSAVLVEDGAITRPIFSSRITDAFENVLQDVAVISGVSRSVNESNTYGRRAPIASSLPEYLVATEVKITDCAESF
ncbi:MAG: metallopeptidase TldD-related protein [Anaerolineae bacterium]